MGRVGRAGLARGATATALGRSSPPGRGAARRDRGSGGRDRTGAGAAGGRVTGTHRQPGGAPCVEGAGAGCAGGTTDARGEGGATAFDKPSPPRSLIGHPV